MTQWCNEIPFIHCSKIVVPLKNVQKNMVVEIGRLKNGDREKRHYNGRMSNFVHQNNFK